MASVTIEDDHEEGAPPQERMTLRQALNAMPDQLRRMNLAKMFGTKYIEERNGDVVPKLGVDPDFSLVNKYERETLSQMFSETALLLEILGMAEGDEPGAIDGDESDVVRPRYTVTITISDRSAFEQVPRPEKDVVERQIVSVTMEEVIYSNERKTSKRTTRRPRAQETMLSFMQPSKLDLNLDYHFKSTSKQIRPPDYRRLTVLVDRHS